jgi:hypothetical protein
MRSYWTCSKFADWLRGTPKLAAGTSKEWRQWKKEAKAAHPFRYWLVESAMDRVEDVVKWPSKTWDDISSYINNRWVTQSHTLQSHTLAKGQWWDLDSRILHCMFDSLVDFVEIETAWKHVACSQEAAAKYSPPWWRTRFFRWRNWRSPEAGISHLSWEAELVYGDGDGVRSDDPLYGTPTTQALSAQETLTLYHWWKDVRPLRPDPDQESGWAQLLEQRRAARGNELYSILDDFEDRTPHDQEESSRRITLSHDIERKYHDEDTNMLVRLVRLRQSLWT